MRDWLCELLHEARVVELRCQDGERMRSGLFDDIGALRAAASELSGHNLYTTLNRPHDSVEASNAMGSRALKDEDMRVHLRLPFDFDPVRPNDQKGQPSTDDEHAAAMQQRNKLVAVLSGLGWPAPALASSGNGAHAVYRMRLSVADDVHEMLTSIYRGMRCDFTTELVEFDPSVRNPSRVWRLYGTTNRKGTSTPERPHRVAAVHIPARWDAVSPRLIEQLAASYARKLGPRTQPAVAARTITGQGDYHTLDVVSWFQARSAYWHPLGHGKHAVRCPWAHEHSSEPSEHDTSTVVWDAGPNWPTFHCSHAHCEGRRITDVMALWGDADHWCAQPWRRSHE